MNNKIKGTILCANCNGPRFKAGKVHIIYINSKYIAETDQAHFPIDVERQIPRPSGQ